MIKRITVGIAAVIGLIFSLLLLAGPASATTPVSFPYETTVTWQMNNYNPNGTTYQFPQTRVEGVGAAQCAETAYQTDTYTVHDQAAADYLASLTTLNSPADDSAHGLSPHDYFATVVPADTSKCATTTPSPPPVSTTPVTPSTPPVKTSTPPTKVHPTPTRTAPHSSSSIAPPVTIHRTPAAHTQKLAATGSMTGELIVLALVLLLFGATSIYFGRRRT